MQTIIAEFVPQINADDADQKNDPRHPRLSAAKTEVVDNDSGRLIESRC
jgi:hypothetical protein